MEQRRPGLFFCIGEGALGDDAPLQPRVGRSGTGRFHAATNIAGRTEICMLAKFPARTHWRAASPAHTAELISNSEFRHDRAYNLAVSIGCGPASVSEQTDAGSHVHID